MQNCPNCNAKLERVSFDIGYQIVVPAKHCKKCGFNLTEDKKLKKALLAVEKQAEKTPWRRV